MGLLQGDEVEEPEGVQEPHVRIAGLDLELIDAQAGQAGTQVGGWVNRQVAVVWQADPNS